MSQPPSPTARGEQAKAQLIAAGIELFSEKGAQTATTREIARLAGQNIAAIFYYFGSKEGLYLAVAQWIADFIQQANQPLMAEIDDLLAQHTPADPGQCRDYIIKSMMSFTELLTNPKTVNLSKILSREQLMPTEAYQLIHHQAIAPLHQRFTKLVAGVTGCDPTDTTTILHTHALLGEMLSFRMARETILLRTGWDDMGPEQITLIKTILTHHIDWILNGLRAEQAVVLGKTL
ncbi:transcriptional regulator CecR [Acerihabitans sp. TG2]|uniref:transcriptional regulator CecR n=1 Tax=Acerihabitans sp. TG2 TaxID=3096008 RepID=UPI002B23CA2E|nr:transcriptional regulator CecR [Acerihabitans sp. TG2]MEA9391342.1 transcriptional regulator CecR [Acerihabitans sp. TG2]